MKIDKSVIWLLFVLLALMCAGSTFAQKDILSYGQYDVEKISSSAKDRLTSLKSDKKFKKVDMVSIDFSCLNDENLQVTLPDGKMFKFKQRKKDWAYGPNGSRTWAGLMEGTEYGTALFAAGENDTRICGTIQVTEQNVQRTLQILPMDDGTHAIVEIDPANSFARCGTASDK
jgi:hypothetical protein